MHPLQGIQGTITLLFTLLTQPFSLSFSVESQPNLSLMSLQGVCVAKLWLALSRSRVKRLLDKQVVGG